ncbi:arginase family protein [Microbacteriaceae bacterium 4G12]
MIAIVSAPTNLGLRPPEPGGVPGTSKAPEALRAAGLYDLLGAAGAAGATDAGVVLPGRYVDDDATRAAGHVRNEAAMIDHARRLAVRIRSILDRGDTPLVLGGDCSLLLGAGLALAGTEPRAGLVHLDGHTDFRHPGNSDRCASVAGEDLAAAVGLHWPAIADIDGLGPYFPAWRVAHLGCREDDEELSEASAVLGLVLPAWDAARRGMRSAAADVAAVAAGTDGANYADGANSGYWLQLDVDILDPVWMPAVDSPDPGGLDPDQLIELLVALAPGAVGAAVTVFDPDLDPDGRHAALLARVLAEGLRELGTRVGT